MDNEHIEPEFPKSNTPRQIKINYSITGEVTINDLGDEYVQFKDKEQQDRYDRKHFISWFENRIKTKGLEHFDFNISMKSKDMDEEMWNEVTNTKPKDENEVEEPPF